MASESRGSCFRNTRDNIISEMVPENGVRLVRCIMHEQGRTTEQRLGFEEVTTQG